ARVRADASRRPRRPARREAAVRVRAAPPGRRRGAPLQHGRLPDEDDVPRAAARLPHDPRPGARRVRASREPPSQHLRQLAGAPPPVAPGDRAEATLPRRTARRGRGLRRVRGDGHARGHERRPPRPGRGGAHAAPLDGPRLASRVRHAAREEGVPADERELRALPAARAHAPRPGEEARAGRTRARRARAVAGDAGRRRGGEPVGRVSAERARTAAVIGVGSNSVLLLTVEVDVQGSVRTRDAALATTRLGRGLHDGGALDPAARAETRAAVLDFAARARRRGLRRRARRGERGADRDRVGRGGGPPRVRGRRGGAARDERAPRRRRRRRDDGADARAGRGDRRGGERPARRPRAHGDVPRRRSAVRGRGRARDGRRRRRARRERRRRRGPRCRCGGCGVGRHRDGPRGPRPRSRALGSAPRARTRALRGGARRAPPAARDDARRRPRDVAGARPRPRGHPARGRARPRARPRGRRRRRRERERARRPSRVPAAAARGRRRRGRLRPALRMTPEALSRAVADAGAGDARRIAEAAAPLAPWLAGAPADAVVAGLVAAADPAGALHAVARLLEASGVPPPPDRVAGVLRVLGGSPALAAVLYGEGAAWPEVFAPIVEVPRRDVAAHVCALVGAGAAGPVSRAALQAALRRHRRREQVRIGGRDLLGLATVDETMREISALAEGVAEVAVAAARARLEAEWGPAFAGDRPAGFAVLGMGKLGGEELNYSSDVDLVYVYETDGEQQGGRTLAQWFTRLAEEVTRALGEVTEDGLCFRVDLRLRPGGGEGPVAVSLPAALGYYETWGQTWERAAWLKA